MRYRNKKTGSEIELNSRIIGGGWEPVSKTVKKVESEKSKKTTKSKKGKK